MKDPTVIAKEHLASSLDASCRLSGNPNSIAVVFEGRVYASHYMAGKAAILECAIKHDLPVIVAWHGQWRTDMFVLPAREAHARFYAE